MSSNTPMKMEVDNPAILKRSSSAPMINELSTRSIMTSSTSTVTTPRELTSFNIFSSSQPRTRRFSASYSPHYAPSQGSPRLTPRVNQLRQEECIDVVGREAAHEKELNNTMVMSQSWEDLTIVEEKSDNVDLTNKLRVFDPIHLNLPVHPPMCSSPSPTRTLSGRQCFSPKTWTTNLSPSPTRKTFATRRSLSPIAMRPSTLGPVKRKFELDDNEPPAKRGGLLMAQSRLDITASPLAGSLSSVGTPESVSSGDSPGGFSFRSLDSPNTGADHPMQDLAKPDPSPT